MATTLIPVRDASVQNSLEFLNELLKGVQPRTFAVRLWDGTTLTASQGQPTRFTLLIQHPGALRRMFSSPSELLLGEAYIYNDCDIEGDIESAVSLGSSLIKRAPTLHERLRLRSLLLRLPNTGPPHERYTPLPHGSLHSKARDRSAIRHHYDVSNDFYGLFLDCRMIYSAACFVDLNDELDTAQLHKLEKICRGLQFASGERFLDIGCGWGD